MKFLAIIQSFFVFSTFGGLARQLLTDSDLVALALAFGGVMLVGFLLGLFPRVVGSIFILFWLIGAHYIIVFLRWLGDVPDAAPYLTSNALAIYFFALVFGVMANFEMVRDALLRRREMAQPASPMGQD